MDAGGWLDVGVSGAPKRPPAAMGAAPRPFIAAVEVDRAGCSYNPEPEAHQDAVAEAVAVEMRKVVDAELAKKAPPKVVDYQPETDELALLQVDADQDDEDEEDNEEADDDDDDEAAAAGAAAEAGGGEADAAVRRAVEVQRKTRQQLNKQLRRRQQEAEQAQKKSLKRQRRDLDSLSALEVEVQQQEALQQAKKARRDTIKREKEASQPPRLGKQMFKPEPMQVLLSEEVNGSLRCLKPTPTIIRDRFKALQKRGIIEPRVKVAPRGRRKKEYVHGDRADRAVEGQTEIDAMRKKKGKGK